eukprot:s352_g7.t1
MTMAFQAASTASRRLLRAKTASTAVPQVHPGEQIDAPWPLGGHRRSLGVDMAKQFAALRSLGATARLAGTLRDPDFLPWLRSLRAASFEAVRSLSPVLPVPGNCEALVGAVECDPFAALFADVSVACQDTVVGSELCPALALAGSWPTAQVLLSSAGLGLEREGELAVVPRAIYVGLEVAAGTVLKPGTLKHDSDAAMARVGSPSSPPPAMPLLLEGCTDNQAIARRIKELRTTGALTTKDSYSELLGTLAQRAMWRQACTLLLEMRFRAMKPFPPSYALVATASCKASQPDEAARVIERLWTAQAMDLIGCGAVLSRFANAGLWKEALAFLQRMPLERVAPDTYAYNNVLQSVRRAGSSIDSSQLLAEMQEEELKPDDYTYSLAIDLERDAGRWEMALSHFRSMQANHIQGNTVVYSAAINACRLGLRPYLAMELLEEIAQTSSACGIRVYTATIDSFGTASLWENALGVLDTMRPQGLCPNAFSYNVALSACQRALQWEEALQLFRSMKRDSLHLRNCLHYSELSG